MPDTFPRQQARTRRFGLGVPRTFTVSPDGSQVLFLRAASGTDPVTALWALDVTSGEERIVVDPSALEGADGEVTAEERARRERRRERAAGIVAYSVDAAGTTAVFALGGELWVTDLASGSTRRAAVPGPVFDPRLDPSGSRIAWCRGDELWVAEADGTGARCAAGEGVAGSPSTVAWGQSEFVAAEEMGRDRGHWWLPGGGLLAARVDVASVATWWIADPAHPDRAPVAHRYPAAGTADADVSLWIVDDGGPRRQVTWDRSAYPYLAAVHVSPVGAPLLLVVRRDHGGCRVLEVDRASGATVEVDGSEDPAWVDWPDGLPARLDDGRVLWTREIDATTALAVDGEAVTPAGLQVRGVVGTDAAGVIFTASEDPTVVGLYRWDADGVTCLASAGVTTAAAVGGGTVVVSGRVLDRAGVTTTVLRGSGTAPATIRSLADTPLLTAGVHLLEVGGDRLRAGVVLPRDHVAGTRLPVLMRPYGGPGAQMVLADQHAWLESQWWADQGFAVVVGDGRGTPGRGPRWERRVHLDFAGGVLDDQVTVLHGAAEQFADLDLRRVGIAGWSFGGYLAALAVLRRPDVFHAAVAGAPVTDWRLYDTFYTEKYLGHPETHPEAYERSSLLGDAAALRRPLLFVHGLVDDNVVVAHTLRLSQRLLASGRPHAVIPLTGVTHMASQEEVAENLLHLELRFLRDALVDPAPD